MALNAVIFLASFPSATVLLNLDFDNNQGTWGRTSDAYGTTILTTDNVDSNNYFSLGAANIHARWVDASGLYPRSASDSTIAQAETQSNVAFDNLKVVVATIPEPAHSTLFIVVILVSLLCIRYKVMRS